MILACDTSSEICSVAVAHNGEILFQKATSGPQIHIEKLSVFLQEAIEMQDTFPAKIDSLAVAIGPGSFNGLRIGLATMKALALSLELPLIPIKTTDALAFGLRDKKLGRGRAVIFSHRNFVHFADYELNPDLLPQADEFSYDSWDQLNEAGVDFYFGQAERGFADWLKTEDGAPINNAFHLTNSDASHVALLAEKLKGQDIPDLDVLEPFYNARYEAKKWVPPKF